MRRPLINILKRNALKNEKQRGLVFHTYFGEEFRGTDPEDVINQLYLSSKEGMGDITFEDWWRYQQKLWRGRYGLKVPKHYRKNAGEKMLRVMLRVGALKEGPLAKG